jgi:threonine dehydrogenase-like Zn-dependent dehydrogenase
VARLASIDWTPLWQKEITIHGSLCYNTSLHAGIRRDAFDASLSLVANTLAASIEPLVTHTVPVERFEEALAIAQGRSSRGAVKVALVGPGG